MARPTLLAAHPQLFVADIEATCRYFEATLGFSTVFTHGAPPFYGQVARDGARLNLRCIAAPVIATDLREREVLLSAYIPVDDVGSLYAEFQASGADFKQPLRTMPWGLREFVVRDPDGNLICFGSS